MSCMYVAWSVGHDHTCPAKMVNQLRCCLGMIFGLGGPCPKNHILDGDAYGCHLANIIKWLLAAQVSPAKVAELS